MNAPRNYPESVPNSRMAQVVNEPISKGLSIIFIADGPITSVDLFRRPIDYMTEKMGVRYSLFFENRLPDRTQWETSDLAIFMRVRHLPTLQLAQQMKADGIRIINVTDDNFEELINSLKKDAVLSVIAADLIAGGCLENIDAMARLSDKMMVFSADLERKFSSMADVVMAPAVSCVEFYDRLDYEYNSSIASEIRIGYAGSPTHSDDVAIVESVLKELIHHESVNILVETIGQPIASLVGHEKYRHFDAISDLNQYMLLQHSRRWDIGIAPLADTTFNRSKSDNKYRTYASAGIPAVYSKIAPFEHSVVNGQNGLLADNTRESWHKNLMQLIKNTDLRSYVRKNALSDVRSKYSIDAVSRFYFDQFLSVERGIKVLVIGFLKSPTVNIDIVRPFKQLSKRFIVKYRAREISDVTSADLQWAEVLVIVRAAEQPVPEIVKEAKRAGKKIVFSWDDDIFAMPPEVEDLFAHYNTPAVRKSFEFVISQSDLVKVSTPRLADTTKQYNNCVYVAPYGFDFSLLPQVNERMASGKVRIGYYGSPGRGREFDCIVEALSAISSEFNDVEIEFFGYKPNDFANIPKSRFIPFTDDYEESIKLLASRQWDIGLAPLAMTDLCRAKLPTKYRDYGAVGAAGVYTDIECYTDVIQRGVTGLIVNNEVSEWYSAIKILVENPELRVRIAENAYKDVQNRFSLECALRAWEAVFRKLGYAIPRV
ncbi:glycosyltransferase family protein [Methylorubrum extorquens]|uniref:glycosyltransferase family protein n=1 Tax=Methylorubrum extorquens TaxID=408 RepID=UPI0022389CB8|nr:glycosyltransferase [Methylorubrum extorquens]UYW30157.1 glycosyltransferase [Methylorubrum extorquens]